MNNAIGVYTFPCFTHEQVKEINKKIKEFPLKKEEAQTTSLYKKGEFFIVQCVPLMELLHPWLYKCQEVNNEFFGFDIYWQFHLDSLNYNVYKTNDEYGWHMDASGNRLYDLKLTCLLNLSEEPYEGGEFYTIGDIENAKFDSGKGLIINSLMAHKVTPVTKGKRTTLTYWARGSSWR